jgi:hypothetical protein
LFSYTKEQEEEEEDDGKLSAKYRDVRDIFGGFNGAAKPESRLRLNKDALISSRNVALRSTYAGSHHSMQDEEDQVYEKKAPRTTPSSPTSNNFSRPPKSPLRLPPRYEDYNTDSEQSSIAQSQSSTPSMNSPTSPKTPKHISYSRKQGKHAQIVEEPAEPDRRQHRRMSSPAERTKRQSHTFPNRNNVPGNPNKKRNELEMMMEEKSTIKGGSLGHKLDRQYRETANEILSKKPAAEAAAENDKEERLILHSKDGTSTTHYVSSYTVGSYSSLILSFSNLVIV